MIPAIYTSDRSYLQSCDTVAAKIAAIDAIIDALDDQMLAMAQKTEPVREYMLNDGQTVIKAVYHTPAEIQNTIDILTKRRNRYANQGRRTFKFVDIKNFTGPRHR